MTVEEGRRQPRTLVRHGGRAEAERMGACIRRVVRRPLGRRELPPPSGVPARAVHVSRSTHGQLRRHARRRLRSRDLARPLAPLVGRVDAVDLSPRIIAEGRGREGGEAPNLAWLTERSRKSSFAAPTISSSPETASTGSTGPSRCHGSGRARPGGQFAIVVRRLVRVGCDLDRLLPIYGLYGANPDFRPLDPIVELEDRSCSRGRPSTRPTRAPGGQPSQDPRLPSFPEQLRSRADGADAVAAFDTEIESAFRGLVDDGAVTVRDDRSSSRCELSSSGAPRRVAREERRGSGGRLAACQRHDSKTPARGSPPTGDGWFVVNVRDTRVGDDRTTFGSGCVFESRRRVVSAVRHQHRRPPARASRTASTTPSRSRRRSSCSPASAVLLVNGEERPLRPWDFVHCPAGTEHVFVGAGEGPS